ncbi:hypothetical protein HJC23_004320 [Cyclotella cryptica]|uniref:Uncharacterized protein n=1 Tax=Cyclotella cryptica TaxID=29204 RepID=A0ABD3Q3Z0_9STRA
MGLELEGRSSCELKLLGDLYSLSEALPPYVFVEDSTFSSYEGFDNAIGPEIRRKLSLLARGVTSYERALELAKTEDFDEDQKSIPDSHLTASAAIDLGSILLAQARVIALALGDGSGEGTHTTMSDLVGRYDQLRQIIKKSTDAFLCAIDANPNEAHAWCGIGCSLAAIDPLKAQHSFARALQLDKSCVEAWSNTGVLFSDHNLREKGSEILDALTQAGDTPFMWICRGFLFEKSSDAWQEQASSREASLAKAADAYRAALQLCQHPSALLGLSLTCRRNDSDLLPDALYSMLATEASKAEGMLSVSIHQNISGDCNLLAGHVNNFMKMERCLDRITYGFGEAIKDTLNRAKADAESLKAHLNSTTITDVTPESRFETTQFDIDCDSRLPLKAKRTGKLPTEAIDEVIAKVNSVSSIQSNACDVSQTHHNVDVNNARNRVYLNPDSGEEWLLFAKALAKEVCTTEYGSNDDRPEDFSLALASAKAAASRAHNILLESVVHASMISPTRSLNTHGTSVERSEMRVVSRVAPASIVSEAMSLVSWLNNLECLQRGEESANLCNTVSMQEAYLLDPINSLASNALGLASC